MYGVQNQRNEVRILKDPSLHVMSILVTWLTSSEKKLRKFRIVTCESC